MSREEFPGRGLGIPQDGEAGKFALTQPPKHLVPHEAIPEIDLPPRIRTDFVIKECVNGFEGRTLPPQDPEASLDAFLRKGHQHLIGVLEGVIDTEAGLRDILQEGEQQ